MEGVHPCMYVTEDINVCILDEGETPNKNNCWNEQNCKNRRAIATDSASAVNSATLMTTLSIVLLYL